MKSPPLDPTLKMKCSATFFLLLATIAVQFPARADTQDDARRRYQQAAAAFAKGDFPAAIDAFAAVYKATGQSKHLWNLALAEYKANRTYAALTHLREYVTKADANPKNVDDARGLIAEEAAKTAHLKIVAPASADVLVDGARVGTAPIATPIEVDPDQPHVIVVSHGADEATQNLAAPGAKEVLVQLSFPVAPSLPVPAAIVPPPQPQPSSVSSAAVMDSSPSSGSKSNSSLRIWLTVGLGVGALAAGGVGVLRGVDSNHAANTANAFRTSNPPNVCRNPSAAGCSGLQSDLSTQQSDHVASMVLYGAAGALAAGAIAAWLFVPHEAGSPSPTTANLVPVFGANVLGASYQARF